MKNFLKKMYSKKATPPPDVTSGLLQNKCVSTKKENKKIYISECSLTINFKPVVSLINRDAPIELCL